MSSIEMTTAQKQKQRNRENQLFHHIIIPLIMNLNNLWYFVRSVAAVLLHEGHDGEVFSAGMQALCVL